MRHNKNRKLVNMSAKVQDSGDWLVSYADVVTVLLCFFIIFYAAKQKFSSVKQDEMEAIVQLLSNQGSENDGPAQKKEKLHDYVNKQVERKKLMNEIKSSLNIHMATNSISVISEGNKLHVQFDKVEFFQQSSTQLTSEGKKVIDNLIKLIKPHKTKIFINIEGYSDPTPIKKIVKGRRWNTNLELSILRSLTVNQYFLEHGLDREQMAVSGFGSNRPLLAEELTINNGLDKLDYSKMQRRISISLSAR